MISWYGGFRGSSKWVYQVFRIYVLNDVFFSRHIMDLWYITSSEFLVRTQQSFGSSRIREPKLVTSSILWWESTQSRQGSVQACLLWPSSGLFYRHLDRKPEVHPSSRGTSNHDTDKMNLFNRLCLVNPPKPPSCSGEKVGGIITNKATIFVRLNRPIKSVIVSFCTPCVDYSPLPSSLRLFRGHRIRSDVTRGSWFLGMPIVLPRVWIPLFNKRNPRF